MKKAKKAFKKLFINPSQPIFPQLYPNLHNLTLNET